MTCANIAVGRYTKFLIEPGASPHTFDASSMAFELMPRGGSAEDIRKRVRLVGGQGITGLLYPLTTRKRFGGAYTYGSFAMAACPGDFERLLPYLVGAKDTGVFYPDDCPASFGILIQRDLDVWEYKDCKVAKWELIGRAPEFRETDEPDLLLLRVWIIAEDEVTTTSWPSPAPTIPTGDTYYPYMIQDSDSAATPAGSFYINAEQREVYSFKLTYDNGLRVKYANSLTAQGIISTGRKITLNAELPWTAANQDLYSMTYAGAAANIKFVYTVGAGTYSTLFSFTNFVAPPESPFTHDENEISFQITGRAYGTPTAKEMSVTNDVTSP